MPATHMPDWRWQQTRVTVRTARSSTQVMLPFDLSEREEPAWEQEEENKGGTSDNPALTPPEPHPESTQVSPTGG